MTINKKTVNWNESIYHLYWIGSNGIGSLGIGWAVFGSIRYWDDRILQFTIGPHFSSVSGCGNWWSHFDSGDRVSIRDWLGSHQRCLRGHLRKTIGRGKEIIRDCWDRFDCKSEMFRIEDWFMVLVVSCKFHFPRFNLHLSLWRTIAAVITKKPFWPSSNKYHIAEPLFRKTPDVN